MNLSKTKQTDSRKVLSTSKKYLDTGQYIVECQNNGSKDQCINGETTITSKASKKIVFHGLFYRSEKNGYGIQFDEKGQPIYEGQHRNNFREGFGKTSHYEGQFKNDKYNGWGRYTTKKQIYEGYFLENQFNGVGIYLKSNSQLKKIYQILDQENLYEFIILRIENEENSDFFFEYGLDEVYIGEWMEGQKHGFGKQWTAQYWYSGQYSKGKYHGNGALTKRTESQEENMTQKGNFIMGKFKN